MHHPDTWKYNLSPEHRQALREGRAARQRWRVARNRAVVAARLAGGCAACGGTEDLTFHHRDPAEKVGNIADLARGSLSRLLAELDKCDLLCWPCHEYLHRTEAEDARWRKEAPS